MSPDAFRQLLCRLGDVIRDGVVEGRKNAAASLSGVARESQADTIYEIDRISEEVITEWLAREWPESEPVEIVMEGLDDPLCFPPGTGVSGTKWKCIIDPIDGTRGLMYDKRGAWALAGIAPQLGSETMLSDIFVAAMTEIPTTKQWRADQVSAVRGEGLRAEAVNVLNGTRTALELHPSTATDFRHGFAWMAKYFPEGRTLISQLEENLWDELVGVGQQPSPIIFDDQYICTGGAFYQLIAGQDRMVGDIRPLIFACLDLEFGIVCHPYDACAALLLDEAGVIYEHPMGGFPDAPLDTTSAVTWIAYANPFLAAQARPVLQKSLTRMLGVDL